MKFVQLAERLVGRRARSPGDVVRGGGALRRQCFEHPGTDRIEEVPGQYGTPALGGEIADVPDQLGHFRRVRDQHAFAAQQFVHPCRESARDGSRHAHRETPETLRVASRDQGTAAVLRLHHDRPPGEGGDHPVPQDEPAAGRMVARR